ncbi:unnamed protein product [Phytophthora fragariaefolia]|uniref:Unnamed protein product n=1 Tax=Phytophthora fragariaefolia TaxID=1490495 RepID=A0A9W6XCD6_9STRA|nr:unnamed protein product [Phytophthora fragariaefolia]
MAKARAVATQFKRPGAGQAARTKQQKRKARRTVDIVRPWSAPQFEELSKEDRDIVLDILQKEVADVPPTRSHAVLGANQVARAVAQGKLKVVVFANNPESLAFGHLPLLCRLHQVPICVLHLSSKTFGRLFHLKSVVAVGIRPPRESESEANEAREVKGTAGEGSTAAAKDKRPTQLTEVELKKLVSTTEFLISKTSKRTS